LFVYVLVALSLLLHSTGALVRYSSVSTKVFRPLRTLHASSNSEVKATGTFDPLNFMQEGKKEANKRTTITTTKAAAAADLALASFSALVIIGVGFPSVASAAGDSPMSTIRPVLDFFVDVMSFLFLARTILSWYPKTDLKKMPYSIAVWPTEPLLEPVRNLVPTQFGVDISAIVWIMLLGLVRELLTGQQGLLSLMERNGGS
jgi:YggT family protein